jgi:hypothetical protein
LLWFAVLPAAACGCGAYLPREGNAHVAQERALIRWDGQIEDIVMALSVKGQSQEAAWILPVPTRATVQLADPRLFEALQTLTKPLMRVEKVWSVSHIPAGAAGGAAVTVLGRQALGPFDVSTLAANDARALDQWLSTNGYQFPAGLAPLLQPYVDQGWEYVAVRFVPSAAGQTLTGHLDPLWVRFESDTIVYPMRPTALARTPVPVFLYVLAPHRVDQRPAFEYREGYEPPAWSSVTYAQWIDPSALEPQSPLAPFVQRKLFLTKFEIFVHTPTRIMDDWTFPFAPADETYHQVDVTYEVIDAGTWVRWVLIVAAALSVVYGLSVVGRRRWGSSPSRR